MFNTFCYLLNLCRLSFVAAFLRWVLFGALSPWLREWEYGNGPQAGYRGGISAPLFGVLAFRRDDGTLQLRW